MFSSKTVERLSKERQPSFLLEARVPLGCVAIRGCGAVGKNRVYSSVKGRKGLLNQKGMPLGLRNKDVTGRDSGERSLFCGSVQESIKFPEGKKAVNISVCLKHGLQERK